MKVNFNQNQNTRSGEGRTVIATNIIKESVMLDRFGNEIDPRTKQIIKQAGKEE